MKVINQRRSVRNFSDKTVAKEMVELILRAGMQAPSAGNQQPWEFLVLEENTDLQKAAEMSPYATPIARSSVTIIVLGNTERCRFVENMAQDLSAATQNMLLEATNLGIGSVWMAIDPNEERAKYVQEAFGLTENLKPFAAVAFGYPKNADSLRFENRFDAARIHYVNK
jgi:nitroreductase